MFRRIIERALSGDAHGPARAPPQTPGGLADSRPMSSRTHSAKSASTDESTDRPQLVAHDVSDAHGGPLVAFYDPEGRTLDGEIMYCERPVEVRR